MSKDKKIKKNGNKKTCLNSIVISAYCFNNNLSPMMMINNLKAWHENGITFIRYAKSQKIGKVKMGARKHKCLNRIAIPAMVSYGLGR
jgi:hypothetical protein